MDQAVRKILVRRRRPIVVRISDLYLGIFIGFAVALVIMVAGISVGVIQSYLIHVLQQGEHARQVASAEERSKLLAEAQANLDFWAEREARLAKLAERLGWDRSQLKLARHITEAARPYFEELAKAVELPEGELDVVKLDWKLETLHHVFARTFCKTFGLECSRGLPPDEVRPAKERIIPARRNSPAGTFYGNGATLAAGSIHFPP